MVVTYIYQDFANEVSSTYEFRRSAAAAGYEVINVAQQKHHVGNGEVLRLLYNAYRQLPADQPVIYADGADSFFLRPLNVPTDRILYSTEKAIWPPVESLQKAWAEQEQLTHWPYLNGGGYCGPAGLLAEFFERFDLTNQPGDANGQWQQSLAYFAALAAGFPIELDQHCKEFQTIGFMSPKDFTTWPGFIENNFTGSRPGLIHGNGRTPMQWVYGLMP